MTNMNYLLLIWENIPETTTLYLIPLPDLESGNDEEYFKKINNKYQGMRNDSDTDDALDYVSNWLHDNGEQFKTNANGLIYMTESQHITYVIISGFVQ
jgi:hypothetical protein